MRKIGFTVLSSVILVLQLSIFAFAKNVSARQGIEDGDFLLNHGEIQTHDFSLGSYSGYQVTVPPEAVKPDNSTIFKNINDLTRQLADKKQFILMYDKDNRVMVVADTTLIKGEANLKTALWNGWEHRVGIEVGSLNVNTGFKKEIFKNTLLNLEDVFAINGNMDALGAGNKMLGSVSINF